MGVSLLFPVQVAVWQETIESGYFERDLCVNHLTVYYTPLLSRGLKLEVSIRYDPKDISLEFESSVDILVANRGKVMDHINREATWCFCNWCYKQTYAIDDVVKRPDRFGKLLYVPLPPPVQRCRWLILKALAIKKPIDNDVDLIAFGRKKACENLSGADLNALVNESAMMVAHDVIMMTTNEESSATTSAGTIKRAHFDKGLQKIKRSVSDELEADLLI